MKILLNGSPRFLDQKFSFAGAHIFADDFLEFLKGTKHTYAGIAYLRAEDALTDNFRVNVKKVGKNRWLIINTLITTAEILSLAGGHPSPVATSLVDRLAETMRQEQADVFFLNGFSAMAYLLLAAAKKAGLPIVAAHHGMWFRETEVIRKLVKVPGFRLRKSLERRIAQIADKDVFLNRHSLDTYEKGLGKVPEGKIEIITLPYNPVYLNSRPIPRPKNKSRKISIIGRWDKIKNHEAFLGLAKAAKEAGKDWEFTAVTQINHYPPYAGIKDEYLKYVKVVPQMPPGKLKKFIQNQDLIVLASQYETFSAVVMETILQNRPILVSPNIPWAKTFKSSGLAGWVTDFKNPRKTVKIAEAAMDQAPPKKLLENIKKQNNPKVIYNSYLKVFKSAINSRPE